MLRQFRGLTSIFPRLELPWSLHQIGAASTTRQSPPNERAAEPQPLSQAVAQLEAVVTDGALPKDALAANRASLETLKSFLQGLANPRAYPRAGIKNVQFSVRRGAKLQRVRCQLKTTGGDCSRLVAGSLGELLARVGLNPDIYFDKGEFQPNPDNAEPPTPEEVASVRAKAAAAGFPSQTITEEQFKELEEKQQAKREEKAEQQGEADDWAGKLRRVDPLFAAVAAVPWMPTDEDSGERRRHIQTRVLDELEAQGWDIRGAAHRVWGGEREVRRLVRGKDPGSQAAIQSLVFHAKQFDEKYGRRVLSDT